MTANGIRILPGRDTEDWPEDHVVSIFLDQPPAAALDRSLRAIAERYGEGTTRMVAMQLEYPGTDRSR